VASQHAASPGRLLADPHRHSTNIRLKAGRLKGGSLSLSRNSAVSNKSSHSQVRLDRRTYKYRKESGKSDLTVRWSADAWAVFSET
jgi:hypothetical protein